MLPGWGSLTRTWFGFELDPPEGRLSRGSVLQHWRTHDYRPQVHPVTLCMRRELALALGGWIALPASSDTALLMAASAVSDSSARLPLAPQPA